MRRIFLWLLVLLLLDTSAEAVGTLIHNGFATGEVYPKMSQAEQEA